MNIPYNRDHRDPLEGSLKPPERGKTMVFNGGPQLAPIHVKGVSRVAHVKLYCLEFLRLSARSGTNYWTPLNPSVLFYRDD